jgi:hypothetical protein
LPEEFAIVDSLRYCDWWWADSGGRGSNAETKMTEATGRRTKRTEIGAKDSLRLLASVIIGGGRYRPSLLMPAKWLPTKQITMPFWNQIIHADAGPSLGRSET